MPRIKPPENETPEERFRRLAKKRAEEVIRRIRVLRNCANRAAYHYSDEQVNTIFTALREELDHAHNDFRHDKTRREITI